MSYWGRGAGWVNSSWLAPSTRQQAAGSSGHVAAEADEEVFGPKLLEQILLCSIAQPQFPLLPLPLPLSLSKSSCKIMNAHAQATQLAGKGVEWGEGEGAGCQLSCKPATWCQQLEKFRPNCQWEGKVRLARAKEEEEEEGKG